MKSVIDRYPHKIEMTPWEAGQVKKALQKATAEDPAWSAPLTWLLRAIEEGERAHPIV